jgi:hypothetical protein
MFDAPHQLAEHARRGKCDKFEEPSEKDLAEHKAMIDESDRRMRLTLPIIKRIKTVFRGKDWTGTEVCPVCGNKLHLRHSGYNGHMMGKCETQNCINWIE